MADFTSPGRCQPPKGPHRAPVDPPGCVTRAVVFVLSAKSSPRRRFSFRGGAVDARTCPKREKRMREEYEDADVSAGECTSDLRFAFFRNVKRQRLNDRTRFADFAGGAFLRNWAILFFAVLRPWQRSGAERISGSYRVVGAEFVSILGGQTRYLIVQDEVIFTSEKIYRCTELDA
jgi:hypothetical protein